jgi:aminoglycoside 6'-N-acetyltransferase
MLFQNQNLSARELTLSDKFHLLKWLTDARVLQYYEGRDRPHTIDMVEQHFYDRNGDVTGCIIMYENKEIGYIQFYPINQETKVQYNLPLLESIYGMDQFIGEVEYWNQGIGKLLVSSMVSYLVQVKGANRIIMDPQAWNERAISCYEKCGFQKIRFLPKHEHHEGEFKDCWLVEYVPPSQM